MMISLALFLLLVFDFNLKCSGGIGASLDVDPDAEETDVKLLNLKSLNHLNGYHTPSKTGKFIQNLISKRFSNCAIFFYRDRFDGVKNADLIAHLVTSTNSIYYNVHHVFPLASEMQNFQEKLQKYHFVYPWSNFTLNSAMNSPNYVPVRFKISVSNYNTMADRCKVVILMLSDTRPEFIKQIFKTITPVYIPITQKDQDHFIFVTKAHLMDKLLLTYELPARTKYKLAIAETESDSGAGDTEGTLLIKSVCFFCNMGNPKIITYSADEDPRSFDYFPDFVLNLNGKLLRIACPAIPSRVQVPKPWEGVNNAARGMWKNLFEDFLMIKFNFTYNIFLSTGNDGNKGGGGTGLELPNGTWIGTVGDVAAGKADIAIITAQTPRRIRQISYTNSFFDISFLFFLTSEGERIFSPMALLWPFDIVMWGLIGLSTFFAFIVFGVLTHFMDYLGMDAEMSFARRGQVSKEVWGVEHQIFFVGTSYLDQDCVLPRFTPLRCFVALWLFFTLIITTVYRAKMTSLLAFPVLEVLPETFDELVKSDYEVGFIKHGDSAYNTLKASTDPVYVKLLEEMEIITGAGLECLERVVSKKYACIGYEFSITYLKALNLSDSETRKLVVAPETTYNIFMGLGLEGGSIYKEGFNKWIAWTRPFHLANLWEARDYYYAVRLPKRDWWMQTNQTEKLKKDDGAENSDLTLKHISGAFYALMVGLLVCLVVFLQEIWYFYRRALGNRVTKFKSMFSNKRKQGL